MTAAGRSTWRPNKVETVFRSKRKAPNSFIALSIVVDPVVLIRCVANPKSAFALFIPDIPDKNPFPTHGTLD